MNWQGIGVVVALVGLTFSLLGGLVGMSFFFGKFFTKFDGLVAVFTRFREDFEKHMEEETRQLNKLWGKVDGHGEKIVEHGQRIITLENDVK